MQLLIDTHVFLWWEGDNRQLSSRIRDLLEDQGNKIFLSAASIWEIAIKRKIGKLEFSGSILAAMQRTGFAELPISGADAEIAGDLKWDHRDPFDRILLAQCLNEKLTLVTAAKTMRMRGEIAQIWAG